ncbi:MAG: aminopeptidase P family protein [Candidatus Thorarchaeota archaeon]|nr:aminopeptidase P family protein [Candidatus Thorarchaeota archaeon]
MLEDRVFREREERVREFLRRSGATFAVVTPSPNFQYLTGLHYVLRERLVALILSPTNEPILIVPSFELSEVKSRTWVRSVYGWDEDQNPYSLLARLVGTSGDDHVAFFEDSMPVSIFWSIRDSVSRIRESRSLGQALSSMRLRKCEAEVELMRKAGHVIDAAVMKAFRSARLGMTEAELSQVVQNEVIRLGAEPTFSTVQFGERSAHPHADSSNRALKDGDLVLLDCGCSVGGYNTDMTRVGVVGPPTADQEKVHSIVLRAEESAIEKISSGLSCEEADGLARRVIENEGYGECFTHRLGHGVGLEVHEPPYLVRNSSQVLEPGMTHSVEPGIYIEGRFGIRIEDLVCVRDEDCEVLTYSPKDLFVIEP